ncbi:hypothetical protein SLEP1_g7672 [Rubroshorea leprosula]|uniref:Uncharacterized protein n=1 Tax=Rubroshorea leprosula TaxID=152421 RepID=A0AAV5HZC8_9ROSI|nr:hypothetical protein SLEP1_g7672 [Rubroshorea leprosula]
MASDETLAAERLSSAQIRLWRREMWVTERFFRFSNFLTLFSPNSAPLGGGSWLLAYDL